MAIGREGDRQGDLIVSWAEMPVLAWACVLRPASVALIAGGFDRFDETARAKPITRRRWGHRRCRRGVISGCTWLAIFEGIASERGIGWRCSDSMSLRDFRRLENREEGPDHSWRRRAGGCRVKSTSWCSKLGVAASCRADPLIDEICVPA